MTTAADVLAVHRDVWDMPTLGAQHPEMIEWLSERYEVVFPEDFTGQVYVVHRATNVLRKMNTTDVREALVTLLEEETWKP